MKWESRSCWFILQQALLRSWRLWQRQKARKRKQTGEEEAAKRKRNSCQVPPSLYITLQNNGYFAYISPKNMTFVYDFSLLKKKWTVLRTVYHTIAGLHVTSHGGCVGGQEQKHFSPLGTNLYFHVNSSRKKYCCIGHQHGRLIV